VNSPRIPNIFDVHSVIKTFLTNIYVETKEDKIPCRTIFEPCFTVSAFGHYVAGYI